MAPGQEQKRPQASPEGRARFDELIARYGRHIYAIAYRVAGNEADAKDLSQEALIRVWRAQDRVDPEAHLEGWLYRIITNLYIDLLRRRRGPHIHSLDEPMATSTGELARERADPAVDIERTVLDAVVDNRIQQALMELPPELRMVVVLADVEGYAYEEIARMIKVPIGTVKSRLHRARRALRARLAGIRQTLGGADVP